LAWFSDVDHLGFSIFCCFYLSPFHSWVFLECRVWAREREKRVRISRFEID
jgi:hypothetical protein